MISVRCLSPCTLISTSAMKYEPLSPLANDGQLKAHSQDSNQIYSPLIGLEGAGGDGFYICVFLSLFLLLFTLQLACRAGLWRTERWTKGGAVSGAGGLSRASEGQVQLWWVTVFCLEAEDLSMGLLNERMLSTADIGSGKQKGRVKSETSLSSFPHCQHIYSPLPRVQYETKHVTSCFCCGKVQECKFQK